MESFPIKSPWVKRETPYKIQLTWEFPPLRIKSLLESNPLKSKLLIGGLGVSADVTVWYGTVRHGRVWQGVNISCRGICIGTMLVRGICVNISYRGICVNISCRDIACYGRWVWTLHGLRMYMWSWFMHLCIYIYICIYCIYVYIYIYICICIQREKEREIKWFNVFVILKPVGRRGTTPRPGRWPRGRGWREALHTNMRCCTYTILQ